MKSGFAKLNIEDFFKGLIVAVLSALVTFLYNTMESGEVVLNWKMIGTTSLTAALAYIIKNYLSNDEGKFLKK
jgi:uncharacterized MnhB-related membrane protein